MKAVIKLDVPEWQIGQEVSVYFKDTMVKKGICEKDNMMPAPKCCAECRLLRASERKDYFQCLPDGRYMYDEDKTWMTEQRPDWCPLGG